MEEIFFLYDNSLIYYPNIFFIVLFFLDVLLIITVILKIRRITPEIKNYLKAIKFKQIKREKTKRISVAEVLNNLNRNRIILLFIVRSFFTRTGRVFNFFVFIFNSLEFNIEKKIKEIEKAHNK